MLWRQFCVQVHTLSLRSGQAAPEATQGFGDAHGSEGQASERTFEEGMKKFEKGREMLSQTHSQTDAQTDRQTRTHTDTDTDRHTDGAHA